MYQRAITHAAIRLEYHHRSHTLGIRNPYREPKTGAEKADWGVLHKQRVQAADNEDFAPGKESQTEVRSRPRP